MPPSLQLRTAKPARRPATAAPQAADDLAPLDRVGSVVSLARDAVLFHEYDRAECYFKVVTGAIRSCKLLSDGRRHVSDFYLPGDFIGLDAETSYLFTAEAVTNTTLVRYSRRNVDALAWEEPRIARKLLSIACHGLSAAQQRFVLLARKTADERIATFLLELARRSGETDRVSLPMNRTDIGDHLGLTMETVSRGLGHLKSHGIIELANSHEILFLDRAALEDIAEPA
jgi:CRP/FNR family transcriptional regulator, anaerobic regulatory protein